MFRFKNIFILFLIAFQSKATAQVVFHDLSYTAALEQAKKERKHVFIDFRAEWCGPCKQMERTTFQDSAITKYLADHTIAIKIDIDNSKDKNLKNVYSVDAIPTMLVLDPSDTSVQLRIIGYKPASILLGDLKFALNDTETTANSTKSENDTSTEKKKCFIRRWLSRSKT